MKIKDKLIQEFDLKFKPDQVEGYKPDSLVMALHEFSDVYLIKKYVLAKELAQS